MASDPSASTHASLLLRVRDFSDARAWQDFVECYAPGIFDWCRRFGLQDSDSADATQMVLIKLASELRSFEYDPRRGRFRGWLKTITRNVTTDLMRTWKERAAGGSTFAPTEPAPESDPASILFEEVEKGYQAELLRRAAANVQLRVKPATWSVWQMTCEQEIDARDAASRLGISIGDVYVAKSRILKMLREEVARLESEDERNGP